MTDSAAITSVISEAKAFSRRAVFFSEALCARYFTYRIGSETHFVLFDDAGTLRRKAELAATLGIENAFFMLPEVSDLLDELFPSPEA